MFDPLPLVRILAKAWSDPPPLPAYVFYGCPLSIEVLDDKSHLYNNSNFLFL